MGVIAITNLNAGINVKSNPTAISDSGLQDCVGFDLTTEGIIETAGGLAVNDIADLLPVVGDTQCVEILYIKTTKYVLATTTSGLYANGILVDGSFTGRFRAVSFLNNIYLVNGLEAIRFDGTACYKWGIEAPTDVPIISKGAYLSQPIHTFEDITTWIANQVSCTISAEGTVKKVGTYSMKVVVGGGVTAYSYVPYTTDLTKFSTLVEASEKDYIRFRLYIDNLTNLDTLSLLFDVGDGTFESDYLKYTILSPRVSSGIQTLGFGTTANVIAEDSIPPQDSSQLESEQTEVEAYVPYSNPSMRRTITVTKAQKKTTIEPTLKDQVLSYWTRNNLFKLESETWLDIKIPKNRFVQNGDLTKGWDTISKLKIEIVTIGAVNVYFDGMEMVGGSDLVGEYYFGYSYARRDENNNILHESGAARQNSLVLFAGSVTFDREPLVYSARPISSDAQVNAGLIFVIGGSLTDLWVLAQINDNTTVTGTLTNVGEEFVERIIYSKSNEPAPVGTDLVLHQDKIWMVGIADYPMLIRSSNILGDGILAPEAWPTKNAYEPEGNSGTLTNIRLISQMPVVKGDSGEWLLQVLDPTDSLQVKAKQVSQLGLIGQDAVIEFETSSIYPSHGGFVESNGNSAQFIMPEVQPLIDNGMINAVGVNAGLVSYFSYTSNLTGPRTAKVDLFTGKPRFSNINNFLLEWLNVDVKTNKVYAIKDGSVFLLDQGYTDESTLSKELTVLLKSKAYQPGGLVSWNRMEMIHNTGGEWYILEVYVDGVLVSSTPFKSEVKTTTNFRDFGPVSGRSFQFAITGTYITKGVIYLPIRIYHGGK